MSGLIKGAVLGGLVVFFWGMFSWMALPWHNKVIAPFNHDADVAAVLDFATPTSGVFLIPNPLDMKAPAGGLMAFVSVSKRGMRPMALAMVMGLGMQIAGAFLLCWMLSKTQGLTYASKILFAAVFGLAAGWIGVMPYFIWWGFPAGFTVVEIADRVIGWTLAGAVIAKSARHF